MKTITFYSYKGGVGRSMALINTAWRLAIQGKRIGVLDLDLEAPGLSICDAFTLGEPVAGLHGYVSMTPGQVAKDRQTSAEAKEESIRTGEERNFGKTFGIGPFSHWIADEAFPYPGQIIFLPVGQTPLDLMSYFLTEDEETKELRADPDKIMSIKASFEEQGCEYLLVDSRTGLCDIARIASILLPDDLIMVLGLNEQNIRGTDRVLQELQEYLPGNGENFFLLPSLVPYGEEERKQKAFERLSGMLTERGLAEEHLLDRMALPYHPQLAVEERPMLVTGTGNYLAQRYEELTEWVIARNAEDPRTKIAKANILLQNDEAKGALRLIGHLHAIPPYRTEDDFLRQYAETCIKAEMTVEAASVLNGLITKEIREDRTDGHPGVPTIKTVLLYNERDKKAQKTRHFRLPRLLKVKDHHRKNENDTDLSRLFSAISEAYTEDPIDFPGFIDFNRWVAKEQPDFAHAAANKIAEIYAMHGQFEEAHKEFSEARRIVDEAIKEKKADPHDLALLLHTWAKMSGMLRDYDKAEECLREAIDLLHGPDRTDERINVYLDYAKILSKKNLEPRKAEIRYLEEVRESEAEQEEKIGRLVNRLADLYEEEREDGWENALDMRRKLLKLEPWDRRDGILRVWQRIRDLGRDFDPQDEAEAQKWLDENPDDIYTIMTVAEMKLLKGDRKEAIKLFLEAAGKNEDIRNPIVSAMSNYAQERWKSDGKDAGAVEDFINAFCKPIFEQCLESFMALCTLYSIKGDMEKALEVAMKAAGAATDGRRNYYVKRVVNILMRLGRIPEALEIVDRELQQRHDDITWPPIAAEAYEVAGALQEDEESRERLLEKALDILEDFEKKTGPMQLDVILPRRYRIWVERLDEKEKADEDFKRVTELNFKIKQEIAVRALPDAERTILTSARLWERALEQTDNMARYAYDEDRWKTMLARKADLCFVQGKADFALKELNRLGQDTVENNPQLLFLRLRCHEVEVFDSKEDAKNDLARLRDSLKGLKVEDLDLLTLSQIIRCELRYTGDKEEVKKIEDRVSDCARWIDIKDIKLWSADAQSAVALFHLIFGSQEEARAKLERLKRIGFFYNWVAKFLHDYKIISNIYKDKVQIAYTDLNNEFSLYINPAEDDSALQ